MNCNESRRMIPAWADQELPGRDAEALQLHLKSCEVCAALARREQEFLGALRGQFPAEAAPPELKARLLALAGGRQEASPAPQPWRLAAALASGLALACVALAFFAASRRASADWPDFYLQEHLAHSAADSRVEYSASSPAQLAAWLQGSLARPAHVPQMKDARLLGGRICSLRGKRVGLAVYESGGKTMSLFMGDPALLCPQGLRQGEGELFVQEGRALSLVAWQHNGHFHVAVSELKLAQLKELARQCQASL